MLGAEIRKNDLGFVDIAIMPGAGTSDGKLRNAFEVTQDRFRSFWNHMLTEGHAEGIPSLTEMKRRNRVPERPATVQGLTVIQEHLRFEPFDARHRLEYFSIYAK